MLELQFLWVDEKVFFWFFLEHGSIHYPKISIKGVFSDFNIDGLSFGIGHPFYIGGVSNLPMSWGHGASASAAAARLCLVLQRSAAQSQKQPLPNVQSCTWWQWKEPFNPGKSPLNGLCTVRGYWRIFPVPLSPRPDLPAWRDLQALDLVSIPCKTIFLSCSSPLCWHAYVNVDLWEKMLLGSHLQGCISPVLTTNTSSVLRTRLARSREQFMTKGSVLFC